MCSNNDAYDNVNTDISCLQSPGINSELIEYQIKNRNFNNYVLCFNFKIISANSQIVLNWSEMGIYNYFVNGLVIYQGDEYNTILNSENKKKKKIWLKFFNSNGTPYWGDMTYIPLGEHNYDELIKITVFINDMGVQAYYKSGDNPISIETSGNNHNGFIFENSSNKPPILINQEDINISVLKVFTK